MATKWVYMFTEGNFFLPVDGKVFVDVESLAMLTVLLPPTHIRPVVLQTFPKRGNRTGHIPDLRLPQPIIVGVDKMDQIVIDKCPKLKAICKFGVGTDNIDVAYAESKNIYVGRTVGSNSNAVAEHVMSFIYCESKNLWTTIRDVRNHGWEKPTGFEVR